MVTERNATVIKYASDIPTKAYVVERHAASKAGNGFSETLMPTEAYKAWATKLPRLAHPIHTKSATFVSRPLQFKGGTLMDLWKTKGAKPCIKYWRDVTKCCEDSKVLGGFNRTSIMPGASAMSTETTMGSRLNGGACDTANLVVTEVLATAMRLNLCGYVIYADVRTAFASLHCSIAMMTDDDGDDVWLAHLVHCGYTPEQAASIIALACDLVKWTQHGGTEHTLAMIKEAHTNMWFSVEGLRECVAYFQGVGAGTPLADAIFCIGAS